MAYIADKPYDDVRLAKAVGACIHAVFDDRFPEYGKTVTSITCIRRRYTQTIIGMPAQKKHAYEFDFKFTRRQKCDFDNPKGLVKSNCPEFTNMFLTFFQDGSLTCETHSDTGKMFAVELDKEVEKTVMWRYQGCSESHALTGFAPIDFKKNIESRFGGTYKFAGFVPTEIAKAIENSETMDKPYNELDDFPVLKQFADEGTFNKIRSTLKKIVTDTIGGNFDYVIEWRFELEKTPRRASVQYKLCKGAIENMLEVVVIFKDGGSNLEVVAVSAEDDSIRETVSCLPHEIRKRFNLVFNEDEKENKEMTAPEVKYALNDIAVTARIEKLSRRNERIKSTLTAIVEAATREILQEAPPSVREYIDNIARIELEDISIKTRCDKLTVAAKYAFIKKYGTAEIAEIGIWFDDEFLTVGDVRIFTKPYASPYDFERCFPHMLAAHITKYIDRDFCRMVNAWSASELLDGCPCKYCKEEKEKKEMDYCTANYIYNVKMTSEMREACDVMLDAAKRQADRKAYYENYKLKARLNYAYGTAALAVGAENKKLAVKEIVINEPAMVVFWEDGTKTVVTARDEAFDAEKGLAMAFAKKALGNNWAAGGRFKAKLKHAKWAPKKGGRFKAKLKHAKWAPKKEEKKKDIFCEENLREDAKEILDPNPKAEKKKTTNTTKTAKKKK